MTEPLLAIEALSVDRGGARVVTDLDAVLSGGNVLSVIGANGAGKSSLLRAVMGLEDAAAGRIVVSGRDVTALKPRDRARQGIGFCPEGRRLFPGLTVEENLAVVFEGASKARCFKRSAGRRLIARRRSTTSTKRSWTFSEATSCFRSATPRGSPRCAT